MEFACYSSWDQLPANAERLFARAERHSLFFSRGWFETLHRHGLDPGQRLVLACALDRGRVVAALPLRLKDAGSWHALSTFHTSLFSVLLGDTAPQPAAQCLADGLARLPVGSLRIEPVADDDRAIDLLQQAMTARGFEVQRLSHFMNWSHPLHGESFERYFSARPSQLRNTILRKRRKLRREHDLEFRLYADAPPDHAMRDYLSVFRASWKDGERFPGFVPALVDMAAKAGWLRLALLHIDAAPAAAQIWFVAHGRASIFRLAYDERWQRYSPGSLLTAFMMEHVIDRDRVTSLDFLTGNEGYKQDWMSERRERMRLVFTRQAAGDSRSTGVARLLRWFS
jgi:ribosomal protein S18 acetylase RimI-like enzyme